MIKRELYMSRIRPFIGTDLVKVMTGIRRCGKSVMLDLIKEELKESGVPETQFIAFNFEDMRNANLCTAQALHCEVVNRASEISGKVYLFFDEIQEVTDWEKCINSLRVEMDCDIYITGSNARLLSGELATVLGGRYVEFTIYPFSYAEFMELYRDIFPDVTDSVVFQKYLTLGGMPYLSNLHFVEEPSRQYLTDVYNSVVLNDVVKRNKIRDIDLLTRIVTYVIGNIGTTFAATSITKFLKKQLEIYFIENKADADKLANQVLVNKRSRETAEKTRINIKKKLTGNLDMNNRVKKFVNCRTKDVSKRELYIVEGDSALGSCMLGRDAEFQGIMPVRGKILNCLKANLEQIFKSEIIVDLLKVLGCGVEIKSKHNKDLNSFDINQLRWDKIIICTDADVDGFQIRTLILTMIYTLAPTLIKEKKVFIAESPLYEISSGKKTYFAYTEKEKADILNKLEGKKYKIQRSKGLGENEPEMMWQTTMNPETRRLILVMPEEVEKTALMFDLLLGDNLSGRKEHIETDGYKYIDLTELS